MRHARNVFKFFTGTTYVVGGDIVDDLVKAVMKLKQQVQILASTINTLTNQKTINESCKLRDEIKLPIKTFAGMEKLEELLQAASTKQAMVQPLFYFFYWVLLFRCC